MGIKIKNLQTGEFEKFNIPALKGEKGEPGEIESSEKVDYIGKQHSKLRDTMNANVDYIIKTAIGEFNYLDYDGQHITATNSIEGHSKSAILKGQTLVNLLYNYSSTNNYEVKFNHQNIIGKVLIKNLYKGEQCYINRFDIATNTYKGASIITSNNFIIEIPEGQYVRSVYDNNQIITADELIENGMIIKYQDGMENWDIPYFEGMASCKMPTLSTKNNLFDGRMEIGGYNIGTGTEENNYTTRIRCVDFIPINNPSSVVMEIINSERKDDIWIIQYDSNKNCLGKTYSFNIPRGVCKQKLNLNNNCAFIKFYEVGVSSLDSGIRYVVSDKSSILSLPEEVVLRSLPNGVCDTFNTRTGVYTQRIGEYVFQDAENATYNRSSISDSKTETSAFRHNSVPTFLGMKTNSTLYCDKFPTIDGASGNSVYDFEYVKTETTNPYIWFNVKKSKLPSDTIGGFKQWLSQNPITIQYELATPIIKTIDLSDNHVYSYKDTTHYDCSSAEGSLVPTLSVKVPTDTQLTIQEQKATTQTLLIKNMDLQQSIKEVQAMNLAFNTALYNSFNSIREEVEDIKKHVSTNENLEGSF